MPTHFTQSEEKIFDEEFLSELHYVWPEIGEDFPDRIKQFILSHDARRDDELRKMIESEMSYIGVLDSNDCRRGYELACTEILNILTSK